MGIHETVSEIAADYAASLFSGSEEDKKQAEEELRRFKIESRTSRGKVAREILQEVESQRVSLQNDLNSRQSS